MLRLALPHKPAAATAAAAAAAAAVSRPALSLLLGPLTARLISSSAVPPNMATTGIANAQRTASIARSAFGGKLAHAAFTDGPKPTKRTPPQVVSADEAVKHIPSNSRVYVHGAACTPSILLDALAKRDDVSGIEFMHLHLEGPNPCMAYPDRFYSNNLFVGAAERGNVAQGKGSYIPLFLSEMGRVMRQGVATPKVALLNVSPPDKHGFVTLGAEVACSLPAAETADILIAQINPHMVRTRGSGFLPFNAFDFVVPTPNAAMHESPMAPISDVERRIGQHIAGMVEDGATLQMGIGAVPNAVLAELKNHKHLGIHTEMFSDGVIELIKSGVVDNSQKVYQKGRTVTSFVVGSQALYDFVDDNPQVLFQEAAVTNDPVVIGSNPKVTAINSAVAVDLTGQVAADSVGIYQVSGVGGQIDFERGAAISRGGLPIICLPSTNLKDGSSKIVNMLWPGTGITTTRYHAHYIVTEHGVASLFGQNYHERARRLIAIAHPDHREQLEREAFERFRIKAWRV